MFNMSTSLHRPIQYLARTIHRSSSTPNPLSRVSTSQAEAIHRTRQYCKAASHLTPRTKQRRPISIYTQNSSPSLPRLQIPVHREFSSSMSSDADYMAFLDKANEDPSKGYSTTKSSGQQFKTTDSGAQIPAVLKEATKDAFYVSDADEPFVPVCLGWEDEKGAGLPDEEQFAALINHSDPSSADIQIMDPTDWDSQGHYNEILEAVTKAGKGNDVRVYKVPRESVKVEYWVVTTDGSGKGKKKVVGVKALAVES